MAVRDGVDRTAVFAGECLDSIPALDLVGRSTTAQVESRRSRRCTAHLPDLGVALDVTAQVESWARVDA